MTDEKLHEQIDETIHQRTRLAIMATLAAVESMEFGDLKAALGLSDGNLSTHLTALEKADYITSSKTFRGRKPLTVVAISARGRTALEKYVALLQGVLAPLLKPKAKGWTKGAL